MKQVGVRDNFFDHGGHSLLAVKLIGQIEKAFGKKLPVAALFQAPTVEQFAQLICQDGPPTRWSSLVPLQPTGSKDPFFWIHGEASDGLMARYLGSDQPLYGLRHQGEDGKRIRHTTVETIASHYASEIRQVQPRGPYLLGGYCFGALVAFEIAHQFSQQGEDIRMLFLLDPDQPKNILLAPASAPMAAKPTMESSPQRWWSRHLRSLSSLGHASRKTRLLPHAFKWRCKTHLCFDCDASYQDCEKDHYRGLPETRLQDPGCVSEFIHLGDVRPGRGEIYTCHSSGPARYRYERRGRSRIPVLVAVSRRRRGNSRRPRRSSQRPQRTLPKALGRQIENSPERTMVHRARPILVVRGRRLPVSALHVNSHRSTPGFAGPCQNFAIRIAGSIAELQGEMDR